MLIPAWFEACGHGTRQIGLVDETPCAKCQAAHTVSRQPARGTLFPVQGTTCLVFDDTGFEEISFFFQIDHLRHPWKWIFLLTE